MPSRAETTPATPFGVPVQGAAPSAFAPQAAAPLQARGPFGKLLSWVADTQQSMQRELATGVKRLKSGNAIGAMLALAGLSFLYGVVHGRCGGHFPVRPAPVPRVLGAGPAVLTVLGLRSRQLSEPIEVDRTIDAVRIDEYDALIILGGQINPDLLRQDEDAVALGRA